MAESKLDYQKNDKDVEVVCYKFYVGLSVECDDERFCVRSEVVDTGDSFFLKFREDHEKYVMEKYFTREKIEEMKKRLIDKIEKSDNPFHIYCADFYHTDVKESDVYNL